MYSQTMIISGVKKLISKISIDVAVEILEVRMDADQISLWGRPWTWKPSA
jgi:hypothetical protein